MARDRELVRREECELRYQGRIMNWKDDKGFGFVTPNGGGQQAFVHIRAFARGLKRPVGNEIITYDLVFDPMGRALAENVAFAGKKPPLRRTPGRGGLAFMVAAIFMAGLTGFSSIGKLPWIVLFAYAGMSLLTFLVYAIDKSAAQQDHRRTPESTLHTLSLFGGWPGAAMAQKLLKHKSAKPAFQSPYWATVFINCGALVWFIWYRATAML